MLAHRATPRPGRGRSERVRTMAAAQFIGKALRDYPSVRLPVSCHWSKQLVVADVTEYLAVERSGEPLAVSKRLERPGLEALPPRHAGVRSDPSLMQRGHHRRSGFPSRSFAIGPDHATRSIHKVQSHCALRPTASSDSSFLRIEHGNQEAQGLVFRS
jgi:hypothetical protein